MSGAVFLEGDTVALVTLEEEDLEFVRDGVNHPEVRTPVGQSFPTNLADERRYWEAANEDPEVVSVLARVGAYRVFNHWHNHESLNAELPKGAFDSDPNITTGQSRIEDAYERANWSIPNWTTTSALWNDTLGDADTTIDTDNILSKNW